MRLYRSVSYLKYWWKATDQHGVHSPFVYSLLCECIQKVPKKSTSDIFEQAISLYLNERQCTQMSANFQDANNFSATNSNEIHWAFIPNIHKNKANYKEWLALVQHKNITISLDCWSFGLIFTKKDQEKEPFVLFKNRWR